MILSFSLMIPFMMPPMVLEPDSASWLPRYVEYFVTWALLGDDELAGKSVDTGSMPESSKKLYISCKAKNSKVMKMVHQVVLATG